jgi:hypothetical protein
MVFWSSGYSQYFQRLNGAETLSHSASYGLVRIFFSCVFSLLFPISSVVAETESVLGSFVLTCLESGRDMSKLKGKFVSHGWQDVSSSPPNSIKKTLEISDRATQNLPEGSGIDEVRIYELSLSGRSLVAIASAGHTQTTKYIGCQIYDALGRRAEFPKKYPSALADVTPVRKENKLGITLTWQAPSNLPGFYFVRMGFIEPQSPIEEQIGISGLMMMTSASLKE